MDSRYEHAKHEAEIYEKWLTADAFAAPSKEQALDEGKDPFSIIMPPPNANDPLHVGHAMFISIEDILIRFARMQGKATLWQPGTDHAGIETQFVFEKKLNKQGKSRFHFDRETLCQMIWDYVKENSGVAIAQMKKLGASADWERYKFTLDPAIVDQVLSTFERMHKDGLIYRDLRLVNYCTKCGTAYSDLEVKFEERNDPLYYLKYGPFTLATVRPETKFGDTAVAVNPHDSRYVDWVGKQIEVEGLLGAFTLTVIADDYVDPDFGTGVVKITPAHDPNDFEVGLRHGLEVKQVIGFDGKLTKATGPYAGLSVTEARKRVVQDLTAKGLIEKIDEQYTHNIGVCYRCGKEIEPLPMPQFFISVKPLTKKALAALDAQETTVHGAGHDKILRHWLTNLRDWNISRQIVWGIRMPTWYSVDENPEMIVGFLNEEGAYTTGTIEELLKTYSLPTIAAKLQTLRAPTGARYVISRERPGERFLQETDTFDTWFSSAQWPVVTLRAGKPGDFDYYYPTSVMETGYDILPFWVMRMMLMGIYLTGKSPFQHVYLHGLVRDEKGQKMSKSKGNVINPLDLVHEYGADALRMALVMSTTAGHDSAVGEQKVRGMRNFTNKMWNAARFVQLARETDQTPEAELDEEVVLKLRGVALEVTRLLDRLRVGQAAEVVHNDFWHWYCDTIIEARKANKVSQRVLEQGLKTFLVLAHPFMPFVTETLWQELFPEEGLLMLASWEQITKKG